ncbi:unnamed protein product [Prorocentrum cordatum]|uniref:SET domain-containing protein n=1 Tax=Prorocentrum cordatum TaxID=2364126 RepID=A0ABN9SGM8_9DINO|nr:unnamed protein product [Polarella glacialis]
MGHPRSGVAQPRSLAGASATSLEAACEAASVTLARRGGTWWSRVSLTSQRAFSAASKHLEAASRPGGTRTPVGQAASAPAARSPGAAAPPGGGSARAVRPPGVAPMAGAGTRAGAPRKRKGLRRPGRGASSATPAAGAPGGLAGAAAPPPAEAPLEPRAECARRGKRKRRAPTAEGVAAEGGEAAVPARAPRPPSPVAAAGCAAGGWQALEPWLRSGGAAFDAVEVRPDAAAGGLGAFARRAIGAGEVAFSLPTRLFLTSEAAAQDGVVAQVAQLLREWSERERPELLLCLRLCRALARPEDAFHAYARSLPPEAPGAAAWPPEFRGFLATTSLGPSLAAADAELEEWCALLRRAEGASPGLLLPEGAFERPRLLWARGMLQSRHFPGAFGGVPGRDGDLCMIPLLDVLNHRHAADVSIRVRANSLEFVCDGPVKPGDQIWNNYGAKGNAELLLCYGFAAEGNPCDSVRLPLPPAADGAGARASEVVLSTDGVPQELIDSIEEAQDTECFVALLRGALARQRATRACAEQLPRTLKPAVARAVRSVAHMEGRGQRISTSAEGRSTGRASVRSRRSWTGSCRSWRPRSSACARPRRTRAPRARKIRTTAQQRAQRMGLAKWTCRRCSERRRSGGEREDVPACSR